MKCIVTKPHCNSLKMKWINISLKNPTSSLTLSHLLLTYWCQSGCCKNVLHAFSSLCRTFNIRPGTDFFSNLLTFSCSDWLLFDFRKAAECGGVSPQVFLGPNKNGWHSVTKVLDFRKPFVDDIAQTVRVDDTEANQYYVCVWVGQRPEIMQQEKDNKTRSHCRSWTNKQMPNDPIPLLRHQCCCENQVFINVSVWHVLYSQSCWRLIGYEFK